MKNYITRYNPFDLTDSFFDDFFKDKKYNNQVMKTDIKDEETYYQMEIEMPSIKKEDIKISLQEGYLTVSTYFNKEKSEKNEHGKYVHQERSYGSYSRSFYVGNNLKQEEIKAKLENGILFLTIPKQEENNEYKYIEIE